MKPQSAVRLRSTGGASEGWMPPITEGTVAEEGFAIDGDGDGDGDDYAGW